MKVTDEISNRGVSTVCIRFVDETKIKEVLLDSVPFNEVLVEKIAKEILKVIKFGCRILRLFIFPLQSHGIVFPFVLSGMQARFKNTLFVITFQIIPEMLAPWSQSALWKMDFLSPNMLEVCAYQLL